MRPTFRTLKIADPRALQTLVVEHAESLEANLRILGERVLLGGSAIDLVALDGAGRLVLIAVALVADDATVLRMLDAFAWCVEYPESVGGLYAVDPAVLAVPPRVMFVSERLSDAFLRKVKHLRMPSMDCLECRYLEVNGVAGLYFNALDTPPTPSASPAAAPAVLRPAASMAPSAASGASAGTEPPIAEPAPVRSMPVHATPMPEPVEIAPLATVLESVEATVRAAEPPILDPLESMAATDVAAEPVVARIAAVDAAPPGDPVIRATPPAAPRARRPTEAQPTEVQPTELLKGLRIPPNLSSQWQRILKRATDAPDPEKIRVVREYLQHEFPADVLSDFYEHERTAHVFQVQDSRGALMHVAVVSDDFFRTQAERDIQRFLDGHRLARALREAGSSTVLVTPTGLRVTKG